MPTFNQIARNPRLPRWYKNKRIALQNCPQKKGKCLRVLIASPRKPNSAKRKVSWILLTNKHKVWGYIPGMNHNVTKDSDVLIRGGRVKDLPGMKYTIIRGKFGVWPWSARFNKRSKYGVKKAEERKQKVFKPYHTRKLV